MNIAEVHEGLRVQAINIIYQRHRLCVSGPALRARKVGAVGIVWKPIPMHNGAWWVRQENGKTAAYWHHEIEPYPEAPPPPEME